MRPEHAKLTVRVPELADTPGAFVEVRDAAMKVVARPSNGATVDVSPGLYLASVTLPTGAEYRKAVEVAGQVPAEVVLGPEGKALPATEDGFALAAEVIDADLAGSPALTERPVGAAATESRCWVRLLAGAGGQSLRRGTTYIRRSTKPSKQHADIALDYYAVASGSVVFMQVAIPGFVPQNVALPAAPGSEVARCRTHVVIGRRRLAASALPATRTSSALIASYLVTGNLRSAASVAERAERMLADRQNDPIGATLGAYALLRLGRGGQLPDEPTKLGRAARRFGWRLAQNSLSARTKHWFEDLARRHVWLPDGAIVAGELARRSGQDQAATAMFALAVRRGLPMFTDGLSLLVSDLRMHGATLRTRGRTERLVEASKFADYTQLGVVLPGVNLTRPDERPLEFEPTADGGWQVFDTLR